MRFGTGTASVRIAHARTVAAAGAACVRSIGPGMTVVIVQVGDAVPAVTVYGATPGDEVNLAEYVGAKTVVMFGVPGAFTPGCSKVRTHTAFCVCLLYF